MADNGSFDTSLPTLGASVGGLWGAGIGLGLSGIKYLLGGEQRKQARSIHPYDPGYQVNNEVVDNARIAGDEYNNYQLPGQQQMIDDIKSGGAASFENATKGATSSGDLLDAANKIQYQQNQQFGNLQREATAGKKSALISYLAAKAAKGAEFQNRNTYEREQFNQQLQLKNQLNNNATANQYSAADQASKLIASIFSYKGPAKTTTGPATVTPGAAIFSAGDELYK